MHIIDLTDDYLRASTPEEGLARCLRQFPALFEHYFAYWCSPELPPAKIDAARLRRQAELVRLRLSRIERRFEASGLSLDDIGIVLFVGKRASSGHAFQHEGRFWAWIPVEMYATELCTDVFVTHEIAHALHYTYVPDLYFGSRAERNQVSRQLVTEGIATMASALTHRVDDGVALWADYFSKQEVAAWLAQCRLRERELMAYSRENFACSPDDNDLFTVGELGDVLRCRGGYYVGLLIVRELLREVSLPELMRWERPAMEDAAMRILEAW